MKRLSPATVHLLKGLMPYTRANLQLAFRPNAFFNELERLSSTKERTLRSAYYRSIRKGLLEIDDQGIPRLTDKGRRTLQVYEPKKLGKDAVLVVIFDVPETERLKRDHLRALLHELSFKKIQQSVWATRYDHREYLKAEIAEHGLESYVQIYEAARLRV